MNPQDGYFQSQKRKLHIQRQPRDLTEQNVTRQAGSNWNRADLRRQMAQEEVQMEQVEGQQGQQQYYQDQQEQGISQFQHNHIPNQHLTNFSNNSYYESSNINQNSNNTIKSTASSNSSGNSTVNFMYTDNYIKDKNNNNNILTNKGMFTRDRIITSTARKVEQDKNEDMINNVQVDLLTIEEAIKLFRNGKITFQELTPENEYVQQKMQFLQHMVSCGILLSNSLSKIAVDGVFETYLQLQKLSSPSKRKSHSSRLFSLHQPVIAHLKDMTFKYIKELVQDSLGQAEINIHDVLKYQAKMEQFQEGIQDNKKDKLDRDNNNQLNNEIINTKSHMDIEIVSDFKCYLTECTLLSQQFEKFLKDYFLPLKTKLFSEIEVDNVIFEDAMKQDEIGYIIKFPEEFIAHKFNDYLKIDVSQVQQQNIELLQNFIGLLSVNDAYLKSVLYEKITANTNKESLKKQQNDNNNKGSQMKLRMP